MAVQTKRTKAHNKRLQSDRPKLASLPLLDR